MHFAQTDRSFKKLKLKKITVMRNIQHENGLIDNVMIDVRQMVKKSMNGNPERLDSFVKNVIKPIENHEYRFDLYYLGENEDRKLMFWFDMYINQFYSGSCSRSKTGQKNFDTIVGKFLKAFHRTVSETIVKG